MALEVEKVGRGLQATQVLTFCIQHSNKWLLISHKQLKKNPKHSKVSHVIELLAARFLTKIEVLLIQ